jgi:nitrite reductase (NADH) large subunit
MGDPLVVVGGGLAATRFVDELTQHVPSRYDVTVIGSEPRAPYNRVLLSCLLAGEVEPDALELKPRAWWTEHKIVTRYGTAATSIDRRAGKVHLADGTSLPYSALVLATGSRPVLPQKPGMDLPGVFTFRDFCDVESMRRVMRPGARAIVIGGGLLGIEAAYGLAKSGVEVKLVHLKSRLMDRQLDRPAAELLKRAIEARNVEVLLEADTAQIIGTDRVRGLALSDGRRFDADFVVCAVGIEPRTQLAEDAGLDVDRGIIVDDAMQTSDSRIFALGECAEHRGIVYGLVEPAYEQAKVLARNLTGDGSARYTGSILATNLKVSGVDVFSVGAFSDEALGDVITLQDDGIGTYKKFVLCDGRLVGAVLFGDTLDATWYLDLVRSAKDISGLRDTLAFGPALALDRAA